MMRSMLFQSARTAAREIGACRSAVGHEDGVVDEGRVADQVGYGRQGCGRA